MHSDQFWAGVWDEMRGKSAQAEAMLRHPTSIGLVRECLLRDFVLRFTPATFRVGRGFVRPGNPFLRPTLEHLQRLVNNAKASKKEVAEHFGVKVATVGRWLVDGFQDSRDCDVLVYSPSKAPTATFGDLVVAQAEIALAVVEVKSDLQKSQLKHVFQVCMSVRGPGHRPRVWTFAWRGMSAEALRGHIEKYPKRPRDYLIPSQSDDPGDDSETNATTKSKKKVGAKKRGNEFSLIPEGYEADYHWFPDGIAVCSESYVACRSDEAHDYYIVRFGGAAHVLRFFATLYENRLEQGAMDGAFLPLMAESGGKIEKIPLSTRKS